MQLARLDQNVRIGPLKTGTPLNMTRTTGNEAIKWAWLLRGHYSTRGLIIELCTSLESRPIILEANSARIRLWSMARETRAGLQPPPSQERADP